MGEPGGLTQDRGLNSSYFLFSTALYLGRRALLSSEVKSIVGLLAPTAK